jgi:hypothetical protein
MQKTILFYWEYNRKRSLLVFFFSTFGKEVNVEIVSHLELDHVRGGVSGWVVVGIAAVVVFLAGVLEGITSPNPCQK